MQKDIQLLLTPFEASDSSNYKKKIAEKLAITENEITGIRIIRRSIDARNKTVKVNISFSVFVNEEPKNEPIDFRFPDVTTKPPVIIVGAGPAGLFAALRVLELGFRPLVFERGKKVSERKIDVAKINREHTINPDSNYCFGEGGAGTFSDGKLYTRSQKRGDNKRILQLLVYHGADESILWDAHPHIGSDKLPVIVQNIRETIINHGGEFYFSTRVSDFILKNNHIQGVITSEGKEFSAKAVILATGHSARDIYEIFQRNQFILEPKPFAMGVRAEHPQELIDSIQYHSKEVNPYLPAASYNLICQVEERGVYSFCMCPGGFILPCATKENELVVNGMSPSKRNSPFANSGIVVEIRTEDLDEFKEFGVLAGIKYQEKIEQMAFINGGLKQAAPAQRLVDFVNGTLSSSLPETSYIPGITSSPMHFWLPEAISNRLRKGFEQFGKSMRGYLTNDAIILGVESRTSSPIRIPRNAETLEHIQIEGLFPSGEGAGFAGGIVSSAVDGERCAEKAIFKIQNLI